MAGVSRSLRPLHVGALCVVVLVSACPMVHDAPKPLPPAIPGAERVGSATCIGCHQDVADAYGHGPHALPMRERADFCENCHGGGSIHVTSVSRDDILNADVMRALDAPSRAAVCLTCHTREVGSFPLSEHARAGVSCWDCHAGALHAAPPASDEAPFPSTADADPGRAFTTVVPPNTAAGERGATAQARLCYQCHGEVEGEFLLQYHHPVPEGGMRCTDCHAVHGEDVMAMADHENERCFSCHAEVRGPFIFEHLAMEDGCKICHTPHGSIVDKLLTQQNNGLCEQCHFDARYPLIGGVDHTGFLSGGALCYDCHFQVHGSNTDENLNPLRSDRFRRGAR